MLSLAVDLSDEQEQAANEIRYYLNGSGLEDSFVLYGLAGTGKTTVLSKIAEEYPNSILCTLTGKAASVLRRKTAHLTCQRACTIHSAFYKLIEVSKDKRGRRDLKFTTVHQEEQLSDGIVLIDECSMISHELANDILRTGAKVVAVGDPGQLPPVKGERFFNIPDFTLETIHRQALESPIIRQAHAVRMGGIYMEDGDDFRVVKKPTDDEILWAHIILCYTNKTKAFANNYARRIRGYIQPTPQVGEPVVCLRNAPDYGIFNGAIYNLEAPFIEGDTTIHINVDDQIVSVPNVKFEGVSNKLDLDDAVTHFDFGYAMTVHKSQGSEWDNVLLIDEYRRPEGRKEWLYTAITRAAKRILIVR